MTKISLTMSSEISNDEQEVEQVEEIDKGAVEADLGSIDPDPYVNDMQDWNKEK